MAKLPKGLYSDDGIIIKARFWYMCIVYLKYIVYRIKRWIDYRRH